MFALGRLPETFETVIMLKSNKDLWDAETVHQCMVRINSTVPPSEVIPENVVNCKDKVKKSARWDNIGREHAH